MTNAEIDELEKNLLALLKQGKFRGSAIGRKIIARSNVVKKRIESKEYRLQMTTNKKNFSVEVNSSVGL